MDRFLTDIVGKMPIVLDDFRFIDNIYRHAFMSYLKAIKAENCILHGCSITNLGGNNYRISEGAVAINSEAFICEQQEFTAADLANCYFVIKESFDPKGRKRFADNAQHDTYLLRRADVQYSSAQPSGSIAIQSERIENILVYNDDSRLTDSRRCNNTFDNAATSRNNLSVYSDSEVDNLLGGKANINHKHAWSQITNKPQTFPPSSHNHAWSGITGKPGTFPPSTHSHALTEITDAGNYVKMTQAERDKLSSIADYDDTAFINIPITLAAGWDKSASSLEGRLKKNNYIEIKGVLQTMVLGSSSQSIGYYITNGIKNALGNFKLVDNMAVGSMYFDGSGVMASCLLDHDELKVGNIFSIQDYLQSHLGSSITYHLYICAPLVL